MFLELLSRAVQHDWLMRLADPAFGRWNPFRADYRRDPYPALAALREAAPRYHHRLLQSWIFTRHDDVETILSHPQMSTERGDSELFRKYDPLQGAGDHLQQVLFRSLLMLDPPDHTRIRALVNTAFTPRASERLTDRVADLTDELLHPLDAGAPFDLVESFATPLPLIVICELLGIPTDRLADLKRWSEILTQLLDPMSAIGALRQSQEAIRELGAYFDGLIAARRAAPGPDLLSALVQAEDGGDRLTDVELISLLALLLAAGHETTTNLLANAMLALEPHPQLRERLATDPSVAERAVDELLRFDGPVMLTDRVAREDVAIGDVVVRPGQMAVTILSAANRDPAAFDRPDQLDFDRPSRRHLAFGHGIHFCVGAALARLEARIALPRLCARLGDYHVDRRRLDWKRSMVLRGPTRVIVQPSMPSGH